MEHPSLDISRSILLVMDYQPAILGNLLEADALLKRASHAIAAARGAGMRVGYVRVAFTEADYANLPATGFLASAASRQMDADSPLTQVHEAVAPQPGDIVVRKVRVGAFSTTDLAEQLEAAGIDTLVLAGVSTSGVVLSTARDAADHDYQLFVVSDLCADRDPEVHEVLLGKVFPRQARLVTAREFEELLGADER